MATARTMKAPPVKTRVTAPGAESGPGVRTRTTIPAFITASPSPCTATKGLRRSSGSADNRCEGRSSRGHSWRRAVGRGSVHWPAEASPRAPRPRILHAGCSSGLPPQEPWSEAADRFVLCVHAGQASAVFLSFPHLLPLLRSSARAPNADFSLTLQRSCCRLSARRRENFWRPSQKRAALYAQPSWLCRRPATAAQRR